MGDLRNKIIVQSRNWLDPNALPIPPFDYDLVYPITVFSAVKRNFDEHSPNLTDEIDSIYRLINDKQDIIEAGITGEIMTWSGVRGQIGSVPIINQINSDPAQRSNKKVPSERAVGIISDTKAPLTALNAHIQNSAIHITDVERAQWNSMAPLTTLNAHITNQNVHITNDERSRWNNKASQTDVDNHIYDTNNPHGVTAHQAGTYTRNEIDTMFSGLRESFFNYINIHWDSVFNQATLVDYQPNNWNPNFVLAFTDPLPDVPDLSLTYFALKPASDYTLTETTDVIIYIKRPGLLWQEVGFHKMNPGDMVIKFPDTTMYIWMAGRFMQLFSNSVGDDDSPIIGGESWDGKRWRPLVTPEGFLMWTLSDDDSPIDPFKIKGTDGIDGIDGKDGQGVSIGGTTGQILIKLSDDNYDTTWSDIKTIIQNISIGGDVLPPNIVEYEDILNHPINYDTLGNNTDGFINQKKVTQEFNNLHTRINDIISSLDDSDVFDLANDFHDHINDFNNPHKVTPAIIGAASLSNFNSHIQNFNNPHNVTKSQIGLGNVDNTSDRDKPISDAVQEVIDNITTEITQIIINSDAENYITNVTYNNNTSKLVFTFRDNTKVEVLIPIHDIFTSIRFDDTTKELVITLPGGSEHRINISSLIPLYVGSAGAHINVAIENKTIKGAIVPGSISGSEITTSVFLRGNPTTTTQPASDRSTRVATTEYVRNQVINNLISYDTDRAGSANMLRILNERKVDIDDILQIINEIEGVAVIDDLDSTNPEAALSANMGRHLDLIKAPRVHTSPSGATFGRATIALFGHAKAADVDPLMDGTVYRGTDDGTFARGDHRHPTDTSRAPIHFPDVEHNQYTFTGEPRAPEPPNDSNDDRIVTSSWTRKNVVGVSKGECVTGAANPNKVVILRSTFMDPVVFLLQIGSTVAVTFLNKDLSGAPPTTLTVENSGTYDILCAGLPLKNGMLGQGYTHLFVFDGAYWRLINPVPGTGLPPITIGPGEEPAPVEEIVNMLTGYHGLTYGGPGATINADGETNKIWITFTYGPYQNNVSFTVNNTPDVFGAKMSDGSMIRLRSPVYKSITRSEAVVEFTTPDVYPSDAPCTLVYVLNTAWIKIEEI